MFRPRTMVLGISLLLLASGCKPGEGRFLVLAENDSWRGHEVLDLQEDQDHDASGGVAQDDVREHAFRCGDHPGPTIGIDMSLPQNKMLSVGSRLQRECRWIGANLAIALVWLFVLALAQVLLVSPIASDGSVAVGGGGSLDRVPGDALAYDYYVGFFVLPALLVSFGPYRLVVRVVGHPRAIAIISALAWAGLAATTMSTVDAGSVAYEVSAKSKPGIGQNTPVPSSTRVAVPVVAVSVSTAADAEAQSGCARSPHEMTGLAAGVGAGVSAGAGVGVVAGLGGGVGVGVAQADVKRIAATRPSGHFIEAGYSRQTRPHSPSDLAQPQDPDRVQ